MNPLLRFSMIVYLLTSPLLGGDALFEIRPVAKGVYAAIARPHRPENANSMFVILDEGVLVIDASSTPSSARALIEEIRRLTPKPVLYVVNTHFHWDHFWGNRAFRDAFPGAQILSTESARLDMERMGLGWPYRDKLTSSELPKAFEQWKAQLAKETDPQRQQLLRDRLEQWGNASEELKTLTPALPDITFTDRLSLPNETQPIEILAPGRGHTSGDAAVYLPRSKILATGDLIAGDSPYIADVNPYDWIRTLDAVERLDFNMMVPGHGGVMKGKDGLRLWRDYFRELTAQTEEAFAAGTPLDAAVEQVSARLVERFKDRFPPEFAQAVPLNVRTAYKFVSGQQN